MYVLCIVLMYSIMYSINLSDKREENNRKERK